MNVISFVNRRVGDTSSTIPKSIKSIRYNPLQVLLRPVGFTSLIHDIRTRQQELDDDEDEEEKPHARGLGGHDCFLRRNHHQPMLFIGISISAGGG